MDGMNSGQLVTARWRKQDIRRIVSFDFMPVELKRLDSFGDHQYSHDDEQLEAATD
tara:strand:+ start:519 stop:686 length:168 start_codon:yes stop_codon:yes gene_type:complete